MRNFFQNLENGNGCKCDEANVECLYENKKEYAKGAPPRAMCVVYDVVPPASTSTCRKDMKTFQIYTKLSTQALADQKAKRNTSSGSVSTMRSTHRDQMSRVKFIMKQNAIFLALLHRIM